MNCIVGLLMQQLILTKSKNDLGCEVLDIHKNKQYIIARNYPNLKHRNVLTLLRPSYQLITEIGTIDSSHIMRIGPFQPTMKCFEYHKYFEFGVLYGTNPKWYEIWNPNLDLRDNTISSVANQYNGYGIWFRLEESWLPAPNRDSFTIAIMDTNCGYQGQTQVKNNYKLGTEDYIYVVLNKMLKNVEIVAADKSIYESQPSNSIGDFATKGYKKHIWIANNGLGLYERISEYNLYNIQKESKIAFVAAGSNHDLKRKCKKGWNIPIAYTYNITKLIDTEIPKIQYIHNTSLDLKEQANPNKHDFQHCWGVYTNYKMEQIGENINWGVNDVM